MTNIIDIVTRRPIEGVAEDDHIHTGSQRILEELTEEVDKGTIGAIAAIVFDRTTQSFRYYATDELTDPAEQSNVFGLIAALDRFRHLLQDRLSGE